MSDRRNETDIPGDEILTLEEAAAFLKVGKRNLYYHIERGSIPLLKAGRLIRFSRRALMDWMERSAARQ
ncbi:MAG: helix-turn-helix domain-containing protein [Acidobacteria bacterium]|nr:helix-turn-helix domain-containing protein [Acidobacteriota bacterium]